MPSWSLFCRENEERTDGRVCHEELCFEVLNFDTHVSFEALHGALIESDQTAAGSVQIGDQGDDKRDRDRNEDQRQPKSSRQRRPKGEDRNQGDRNNEEPHESQPDLNRCFTIPSLVIFVSSVDLGIPSLAAAPDGPAIRPRL